MRRQTHSSASEQLHLFLPSLTDIQFRDQREMMERPFFSLAKSRRINPIDYRSPDGKLWVHVSANADYGMATIWDADILIYCASVLSDMARRGVNDIPRTLHIMPYDLLKAIGRPTTGRAYELLGQALDRLVSTTIKTNIRAATRREATFTWLDGWTQLVDEQTERSRGMTLELSNWFYEGVLMKGGVLSIDRAYFNISGGRERWLYKVARKHAGGNADAGFAIAMPTLFQKSGAEGEYRRFKFEILKIVAKNGLPGFDLLVEAAAHGSEPLVRMRRTSCTREHKADGRVQQPDNGAGVSPEENTQKVSRGKLSDSTMRGLPGTPLTHEETIAAKALIRQTIAGLSTGATRGILTEETVDVLEAECPGWDLQVLHREFAKWVSASPERSPANWQSAFIGWVRQHHKRNRPT